MSPTRCGRRRWRSWAGPTGSRLHLREDRRHIQERDLRILRETVTVKLNLELAASDEILAIACQVRPDQATLVPERREEVTTEGGLDVLGHKPALAKAVKRLKDAGHRGEPVSRSRRAANRRRPRSRRRRGRAAHRPLRAIAPPATSSSRSWRRWHRAARWSTSSA